MRFLFYYLVTFALLAVLSIYIHINIDVDTGVYMYTRSNVFSVEYAGEKERNKEVSEAQLLLFYNGDIFSFILRSLAYFIAAAVSCLTVLFIS